MSLATSELHLTRDSWHRGHQTKRRWQMGDSFYEVTANRGENSGVGLLQRSYEPHCQRGDETCRSEPHVGHTWQAPPYAFQKYRHKNFAC